MSPLGIGISNFRVTLDEPPREGEKRCLRKVLEISYWLGNRRDRRVGVCHMMIERCEETNERVNRRTYRSNKGNLGCHEPGPRH